MSVNILRPGQSWEDPNENRILGWLKQWDPGQSFDVAILAAPLSNANTQPNRSWAAADAIRRCFAEFTTYSSDYDVDIEPLRVADLGSVALTASNTDQNLERIADAVRSLLQQAPQTLPVVIGGDHTITAASAKGFCQAYPKQRVGLLYFDAHHDVRVLSDNIPVAGSQVRLLLRDCPNLSGANVAQIGVHGFMNSVQYKHWAEQQGIHLYSARTVREAGIRPILARVMDQDFSTADVVYVSVDIDVLSQVYAIGASGRTTPDGMEAIDLFDGLFELGQNPKVRMMDLVEYDPSQDLRDLTARTCCTAILSFLAGLVLRKSH